MLHGMDLFAIDDSAQRNPRRDGMGPLIAVGGLHIPGWQVRELEIALDALCTKTGFPSGEEFKWSPQRGSWMRTNLEAQERVEFYLRALALAAEADAAAIVVIEDTSRKPASSSSKTHAEDVTKLFLERAHSHLPTDQTALVVFDRQGGGRSTDAAFLASCMDRIRTGTEYTKLDRLALALSTDSKLSRVVQLADVVTSCTTSFVGGERKWSPTVFEQGVLTILREDWGRKGGCGLKLHPDLRYGNLYHWLLGDDVFVRFQGASELPSKRFTCYRDSPNVA
jgi:hypothetical protein